MTTPRKLTIIETQFAAAVCTEAIPQQQCSCGRLHFAAGAGTALDLETLTKLRTAELETPEQVIGRREDTIMAGQFGEDVLVAGCPCEGASRFGNWLWGNRAAIARFLRGMTEAVKRDVEGLEKVLPFEP